MKKNKRNFVIVAIAVLGVISIGLGMFLSFNQDKNENTKISNVEDDNVEKRDACDYTGLYGVEKYMVQSRCHTYNNNLSKFISEVANKVNAMDIPVHIYSNVMKY